MKSLPLKLIVQIFFGFGATGDCERKKMQGIIGRQNSWPFSTKACTKSFKNLTGR
jgi:hypothetical protein